MPQIIPVKMDGAVDIMGQLSNIRNVDAQTDTIAAKMPGVKADSARKVQETADFLSEIQQKKRDAKAQAETVKAEREVELAGVQTDHDRAVLEADAAEATTKLGQQEIAQAGDMLTSATPATWEAEAAELNKLGYTFTGDWEVDKVAREKATSAAVNNVEQRRKMDQLNIQIEVAKIYRRKPEMVQIAREIAGDNEELFTSLLLGYWLTEQAAARGTPNKAPKVTSPTKTEIADAKGMAEALRDNDQYNLHELSDGDFKLWLAQTAHAAKRIQAEQQQMNNQSMDYLTALQIAVQEMGPRVVQKPGGAWGLLVPLVPDDWGKTHTFDPMGNTQQRQQATPQAAPAQSTVPAGSSAVTLDTNVTAGPETTARTPTEVQALVRGGHISKEAGMRRLQELRSGNP